MKQNFPGYYRPSEEDFSKLWDDCIFSLDANILLNLYRYSPKTRTELLKILTNISDRIWVPYQAAEEYQKNRLSVILKQEKAYEEMQKFIEEEQKKIESALNSIIGKHPIMDDDHRQLWLKDINGIFNQLKDDIKTLKASHPDMFFNDTIRDELTSILNGKVGEPCSESDIGKIIEEGKRRYEKKVPPGWKDSGKDGGNLEDLQKYGDLILWFQIIDKAKSAKKNIIFVTDDKKEDWWWKIEGKTIGPHYDLVKEFVFKTGFQFYMYQADPFMEFAKRYLDHDIDQTAIDEVKEIRTLDEEDAKKLMKVGAIDYSVDEDDPEDEERIYQIMTKIKRKLKEMPGITEEQAKLVSSQIAGKYGEDHELHIEFHN